MKHLKPGVHRTGSSSNTTILEQATAGMTIKEIVRKTGHSRRGLVRRVLRGQRSDVFRTRESSLEPYLPWLDAQWATGDRNGTDLWRRLKLLGFRGTERVVGEWATRRRHADKVDIERLRCIPSARTIARLMTTGRDDLIKTQTLTTAAIENGVPALVEAQRLSLLPRHDPKEGPGKLPALDRTSQGKPAELVRRWHWPGSGSCVGCDHITLVERSG